MCLQVYVSVLTGLNLAITKEYFGFRDGSDTGEICTAFRKIMKSCKSFSLTCVHEFMDKSVLWFEYLRLKSQKQLPCFLMRLESQNRLQ